MTTLHAIDLHFSYGKHEALRGIDLDLGEGEILSLVGPNGAGKSSLIRALCGSLPITRGSVRLGETDLLRLDPAKRARLVAVVPQSAVLPAGFRVADIVLLGRTPYLSPWGHEREADLEAAWHAMRSVSVEGLAQRLVETLSGGERQRVVLARALAQGSKVLLLDEATAHLDLRHQVESLELLRRLTDERRLIVLATFHDLSLASLLADRVALMARGALVGVGPAREVLTPGRVEEAYGVKVAVLEHPGLAMPAVVPLPRQRPSGEA